MTIVDKQKIDKLINHIYVLVRKIEEYERDLTIYRTIDQYHLIQKAEELKLLMKILAGITFSRPTRKDFFLKHLLCAILL